MIPTALQPLVEIPVVLLVVLLFMKGMVLRHPVPTGLAVTAFYCFLAPALWLFRLDWGKEVEWQRLLFGWVLGFGVVGVPFILVPTVVFLILAAIYFKKLWPRLWFLCPVALNVSGVLFQGAVFLGVIATYADPFGAPG